MIIHRKPSKMKNKILPSCLHGNYGDNLGEFSNTSYGVVGAERVNSCFKLLFIVELCGIGHNTAGKPLSAAFWCR